MALHLVRLLIFEFMSKDQLVRAVIIDDNEQSRKLLRLMINDLAPQVHIEAEAENAEEGLEIIQNLKPDAVFLDIEMPGQSGLQLAEKLNKYGFNGKIVFTTAYNSYAIQAFRLSAIDYLLKPIQEDQLEETVVKLMKEKTHSDNVLRLKVLNENLKTDKAKVLCIPSQNGFEYMNIYDVYFLQAEGSYVRIVCKDGKPRLVAKNLKYFESSMESIPNFIRTHRSFLVNMDEVISYSKTDGGSLSLSNGVQIPISRERKAIVQEFLK
jgi:two-component system, LytTR family, response regulator